MLLGELLARPRPHGGAGFRPRSHRLTGLAALAVIVARRTHQDAPPSYLVRPGGER